MYRFVSLFLTPDIRMWAVGLCMVAGLLLARPVVAEIYVYVDKDGVMHFTNASTSSDYQPYFSDLPKQRPPKMDTSRFDAYIDEAATFHGLDFCLIKAVIHAESGFDPKAVSRKGALGLMQIMPKNLDAFHVYDPFDPRQNIMGGARYLKRLLERFDDELSLALAAYNAGPGMVDVHQGVPPFRETQMYIKKVMKFMEIYRTDS